MEKIYTIPVNDAYNIKTKCPFCTLYNEAEAQYLEYYMGPSLMEPDTRKLTNKLGFCPSHMGLLNIKASNRLGIALMIHTHLKDINSDIMRDLKASIPTKASLLKGRDNEYKGKLKKLAIKINQRTSSCPICDNINITMDRYIEVVLYLYKHDPDFKMKFDNTDNHCLPHVAMLLQTISEKLSQNDSADILEALYNGLLAGSDSLTDDVEKFTLKFDYRNKDIPWGNSKNSTQRAMRYLSQDRRDFDEQ